MARGDDSNNNPAPPRRNPFKQVILTPNQAEKERIEKRAQGEAPPRLTAPAKRYEHDSADLQLLRVDLGQQIGGVIHQAIDKADGGIESREAWIETFEEEMRRFGFLSPSSQDYLRNLYNNSNFQEPEAIAEGMAWALAEDIMAYSEASGMAYGEAYQKMVADLNGDEESRSDAWLLIRNFLPLTYKNNS